MKQVKIKATVNQEQEESNYKGFDEKVKAFLSFFIIALHIFL